MWSVIKFASVLLVLLALGALQIAVPSNNARPKALQNQASSDAGANTIALTKPNLPLADYQNAQRGSLFFITEKQDADPSYALSPTLRTDVNIQVTGFIARTKLSQTFRNDSNEWLNGLYVFPLPENAAVDHLQMRIGERIIEGQIKEKQQAKALYEQAKQQGKKASLIVQQRPNLFTNSVANIGPGESITVVIEYQQSLDYQNTGYQLRFPLTITPRYSPTTNIAESISEPEPQPIYAAQQTNEPSTIDEIISLEVIIKNGFSIQNIQSEFHPINSKTLANGDYLIALDSTSVANQDFVLSWQPELGSRPKTAHFQQNANGKQYGLMMIYPPYQMASEQSRNRELIFILDTSGSMSGESLKQAKGALLFALRQLKPSDSFNIIEFNSYAQNLWLTSRPASFVAVEEASHFVDNLHANGGTEMASALKLAFDLKPASTTDALLRQIVFITDGSVGNEESLMQLINNKLMDARLFTVGIGSAPNSYFMTEAAQVGRGSYTYIGDTAQVQEKMQTLLAKLAHPALTDLKLWIGDTPANQYPNLEFYPKIISDLYLGEPLVISYQVADSEWQNKALSLRGNDLNQPWSAALNINRSDRQSGLNVLWARQKINQLVRDRRRANTSPLDTHEADYFKQLITQTALENHLVSQYTSLVAIDITPSKPLDLLAKQSQVANQIPAGSKQLMLQLPATATLAELHILLGAFVISSALCLLLLMRTENANNETS